MKKKLFILILITTLIIFATTNPWAKKQSNKLIYFSYCDEPFRFRVNRIDEEFGLNRNKIIEEAIIAADIWNNYYGKDLLIYDDSAQFVMDLVFDTRQNKLLDLKKLDTNIKENEPQLQQLVNEYESNRLNLENRVNEINQEIQYWNEQGGAPPDEYNKLLKEQREVKISIDRLNEQANILNNQTNEYNKIVEELNNTVNDYNNLLDDYPEGGLYIPYQNKIEIYIYGSKDEFIHLAAHELGHALGLGHVENEESIMYQSISNNLELTQEDINELKEQCKIRNRIDIIKENFNYLLIQIKSAETNNSIDY